MPTERRRFRRAEPLVAERCRASGAQREERATHPKADPVRRIMLDREAQDRVIEVSRSVHVLAKKNDVIDGFDILQTHAAS